MSRQASSMSRKMRLLVVTATGLVLIALVALVGSRMQHGPVEVVAEFEASAGLFVGNDVGIRGVKVGQITSIEPRGKLVEVGLKLDRGVEVPAGVGAVVVSRSVATDRYVELTPVDAPGKRLADGARIPLERTRTPVEFDEVVASLGEFSEGLLGEDGDGKALRAILAEGADALEGRGESINRTVKDFAAAAKVLSGHKGDLVGTVEELDALTTLLVTNRDVIDQFVTSVSDATNMFAEERENFGDSLTALSRALRSLSRFVRTHQGELKGSLSGLTKVTTSVLRHQKELEETVEVLPLTLENLGNAIDETRRLDVKLPLQYLSPSHEVTEAVCAAIPAVCEQLGTNPDLIDLLTNLLGGAR